MDSSHFSLTIVVPAYNEAEALPLTLQALLDFCDSHQWWVVVVDDGSTDSTWQILEGFAGHPRLKIMRHKLNRGYGSALKTGLSAVETELAVTFDADGQHRLEDILHLLNALQASDADMVVGSRPVGSSSSRYREIGKWLIRKIAGQMMPMPLKDLNSGFKLYRTDLAQRYLNLCPDSMAFSDVITLIFLNEGHKVIEEPIEVLPRKSGTSTINTRTAIETVMEILNLVMLLNPLRIFLPISFILVLLGLIWGIPIILMGRGVSVGAMLAIVAGLITFTLGLIAQQLSEIRKASLH